MTYHSLELWKNIPAEFLESLLKYSAAHPQNAPRRNISASHSQNLERNVLTLLCIVQQKPGLVMSMLMFSNSTFSDKKVACSTMLKYN